MQLNFVKVGIHHNPGSFSDRWLQYCEDNSIPYTLVDCYRNDIYDQLIGCDALFFHWHHKDYKASIFMRHLTLSLRHLGIAVFPDFSTSWHFDDKIAQKYLLESIGAPTINTYISYSKKEAEQWAKNTIFPKVFKLRGGAGASNVFLVKNKRQALKVIKRAFGEGFSANNRFALLSDKIMHFRREPNYKSALSVLKGVVRLAIATELERYRGAERGYVYFQDFIPKNDSDIRVIVIGDKAFALKRFTRENDFRASGSGLISYDVIEIDTRCIEISFAVSKKIKAQCLAFDFIFDEKLSPLIVEISYGFSTAAYDNCKGYWTEDLCFHPRKFNPQAMMIENTLNEIKNR